MSIGDHFSEIARQFWASLTGGWYYEPANSIFCNTLHFYLWCVFLILPFLLGITSTTEAANVGWICAYIMFIFVLFFILKFIVYFLNNVFDVVEPIITQKTKRSSASAKPANPFRSPLSSFSARATESNAIEMIDLIAEHGCPQQEQNENGEVTNSNRVSSNYSLCKISDEHDKHVRIDNSLMHCRESLAKHGSVTSCKETTQPSSSLRFHGNALNINAAIGNVSRTSTGVLLLTDSLELLPLSSSGSRRNNLSINGGLRRTISYSRRKYSDPNTGFLSVRRYPSAYRRADERTMPIRRVHSTGNRMNYIRTPTKTQSATIFSNFRFRSSRNRKIIDKTNIIMDDVTTPTLDLPLNFHNEVEVKPPKIDDSQQPCCSNAILNRRISISAVDEKGSRDELRSESIEIALESKSFFAKTDNSKSESFGLGSDLKGEITKFLEELIEKHPETLDAIESVRMNRLGRMPLAENTLLNESARLESGEDVHEADAITQPNTSEVYQLNIRDGTHVAHDHEDTSQGAIHSFQDEHGNWWTYAFDDQSSGTAQALGSSRAIYAMFNKRRRHRQVSGSKSVNLHFNNSLFLKIDSDHNRSYEDVLDKRSHLSYNANDMLSKKITYTNTEVEIIPKIEVIEVLSRSGRHLPHHEIKKEDVDLTNLVDSKRQSPTLTHTDLQSPISNLNNPSSSSASMSSSTDYDSPLSSSSSEASDDAELSKYIADRPIAMFCPTTNGTSNTATSRKHSRHAEELQRSQQPTRHSRYPSDSVFTSFLYRATRNPFYNAFGGGLANASGGRLPNILPLDRAVRSRDEESLPSNIANDETIKENEAAPGPSNRTRYHRRRRGRKEYKIPENQTDSNVMEHYYKHLRHHHRRHHRNGDGQQRSSRAPDPQASLHALEMLQSSIARPPPYISSSANVGSGSGATVVVNASGRSAATAVPTSGRLLDDSIADGLRGLARRTLNTTRYNIDSTGTDLSWRNFSRDSRDSVVSATIPNDAFLPRNSSTGVSIRRDLRSLSSIRMFADLQPIASGRIAGSTSATTVGRTKVNYYYMVKLIPRPFSTSEGLKIQIDRLSLSALFDRNFSLTSAIVDVVLSTLVAGFAATLGSMNIYGSLTLPIFAFVVAGSQFSLLKSVQPDAASPVHGFNWLIAYSRPVYFCLLAFLFFVVDFVAKASIRMPFTLLASSGAMFASPHNSSLINATVATVRFVVLRNDKVAPAFTNDVGWFWTAPWLHLYGSVQFFVSLKNVISTTILFLPVMFTLGLLPQVDTMLMHILEQVDIHFFGATASFSLLSAMFSLARSVVFVAILTFIGYIAHDLSPHFAQNIAFSAFVACTVSTAFLASRWSTNPLVYRIILDYFRRMCVWNFGQRRKSCHRRRQNNTREEGGRRQHNHRVRRSSSASELSVDSSCCMASLTSNTSTTNVTKPFIKSFCCTKFSLKSNVIETSTATAQGIVLTNLQKNAAASETLNVPTSGAINKNNCEVQNSDHNKLPLFSDDLCVMRNVSSTNTRANNARSNNQKQTGRRSSLTSIVSAPDPSYIANTHSGEGKSRNKAKVSLQKATETVVEKQSTAKSSSAGRHIPAESEKLTQRSKSIDYVNVAEPTCRDEANCRISSTPTFNDAIPYTSSKSRSSKNEPTLGAKTKTNMLIMEDTLPASVCKCVIDRLHYDSFYFVFNTFLLFGIHSTSLFTATQPYFEVVITVFCIFIGVLNHYLYSQLRKNTPWKLFRRPILRAHEYAQHETVVEARLTAFEKAHAWLLVFEKSLLYPLLVASLMTIEAWKMPFAKVALTALCGFRVMRSAFSQPQLVYLPLAASYALFWLGWVGKESFLTSKLFVFYALCVVFPKIQEFSLKLNFILVYIAPWQISWGSAFHAFAQPFSVPHTGIMCAQAALSSLLSAPLNPFLGSSFFLMSYVRPVKFWEKDYNTKRIDHSNLRLISQLDRGPMLDDSNLNAIFYEHLTRSLQKWLAGDLLLGRWATSVQQGDYFILASLYINCLVHIIEVGNGFITFQVRGLEFRGTYCHQREVEAISEDTIDGGSCCCCTIGKLPGFLSFNHAWSLRWLAWEVVSAKYVIDGYSITDNSAVNLLQVHELRRLLVTLYVKCIIYYAFTAQNFDEWLINETVLKALQPIQQNARFVDTDPMFCAVTDEDYDVNLLGISKICFVEAYGTWIEYCWRKRRENSKTQEMVEEGLIDLNLVTCFSLALSILGRRALGTASFNRHANSAESFLFGLHALFKGDMRITSIADEWVFTDPEILSVVISPAVRMSLKLHQDHFLTMDEFEDADALYTRIQEHQSKIFISHEHDPVWRAAIIANTPSLLALRHIFDDGQDDYKIIMLNKMALNMRVIKLNRECVRAFWSGQQQELIFLRNRNPERGSIQNARQVLRNMINSSADQPIGYPIYVSPLVTSFVEMHPQVNGQIFSSTALTFCSVWKGLQCVFSRLRQHFGSSSTSSNWQLNLHGSAPSAHCREGGDGLTGPRVKTVKSTTFPARNMSQQLSQTASSGPRVIGPAVSPAGSTPAPYRKHHSSRNSGGSHISSATITMSTTAPTGPDSHSHQHRQNHEHNWRQQQHSSAPPSIALATPAIEND